MVLSMKDYDWDISATSLCFRAQCGCWGMGGWGVKVENNAYSDQPTDLKLDGAWLSLIINSKLTLRHPPSGV